MSYSPRELLKREPAVVSAAVIAVINVPVVAGLIELSGQAVGAIDLALVAVLGLFYVRPTVTTDPALLAAPEDPLPPAP